MGTFLFTVAAIALIAAWSGVLLVRALLGLLTIALRLVRL